MGELKLGECKGIGLVFFFLVCLESKFVCLSVNVDL